MNEHQLKFKVSTALKNIIGRDLINDRYIAVFELVKNSYDAGAHNVTITFENIYTPNGKIIIEDDGCGMSYEDINNKWLFVAYSEKRAIHRDENDYRNKIKRKAAGAKGVGRFSCDRLGANLTLITKPKNQKLASSLFVDWNKFEVDDTKEFMEVNVLHNYIDNMPNGKHKGTIIEIQALREEWDRESLLTLKRSLMKLVNPFAANNEDEFNIFLYANDEVLNDDIGEKKEDKKNRNIVNGLIVNDIFEKLNIKTINLNVSVSEDGNVIKTKLSDRGEYIFEISEENRDYPLLKNIDFSIFYLNRKAKYNFHLIMGIESVNYGSIFVYKNGFRIYPFGEPGYDFFGIDRRKTQGYNRYLGTREIMGRILINGENEGFIETTSRDGGFINTPSVTALDKFFKERVLKTLERYVVDIVQWAEPIDNEELSPKDVIDKIVLEFAGVGRRGEIIDIDYNPEIMSYINSTRDKSLEGSISKLEKVASKTQNIALIDLTNKVKKDANLLFKQKTELEKENLQQNDAINKLIVKDKIREEQVFFLKGVTQKNVEYLLGGMHEIFTLSDGLMMSIENLARLIEKEGINNAKVKNQLAHLNNVNKKIRIYSKLAIKGNFELRTTNIQRDIYDYINQYVNLVASKKIKINVQTEKNKNYFCLFDVSTIGILIDNIISNSFKAGAKNLNIFISDSNEEIIVSFKDDGRGIDPNISDANILFELGTTTTDGFGLGLYHIKQLIEKDNGKVYINKENKNGFELIVKVRK